MSVSPQKTTITIKLQISAGGEETEKMRALRRPTIVLVAVHMAIAFDMSTESVSPAVKGGSYDM